MNIIESKLAEVLARPLKSGKHDPDSLMCVMEAVAYVAGEDWSDSPRCACPVISAFMRSWNDSLPNDAERDRLLKPLISRLVDSKSTEAVEKRRSYLALDWMVRVFTPKFLDLVPALASHAKALREHEEIEDMAGAVAARKLTVAAGAAAGDAAGDATGAAARAAAGDAAWNAARAAAGAAAWNAAGNAAWDAAGNAAGNAARAAAWDAAGAAAWNAAGNAAWDAAGNAAWDAAGNAAWNAAGAAAWNAAWNAAGNAARAAAWDAARAAAWNALKPTVEWCQVSALDLVDRMLAVQPMVAMGMAR